MTDTPTEQHGMKGWGRKMGVDQEEPRTLEEAELTALLMISDRLLDLGTAILDMKDRLTRIENWLEETIPSYRQSALVRAHQHIRSAQEEGLVRQ